MFMRDVIIMWRNTRMVVLTAVVAAVYAAILIPFKIALPLIPGFTEIRPASVIPIICSLMFGPAAAWGAAFGNLIGDFFGTLTLGSIFGFFGNFLYGLIPYKLWRAFFRSGNIATLSARYFLAALISCVACGAFIGWGVHLLGLLPFSVIGNIIVINNFLVSILLGPILLPGLYRVVRQLGLIYTDVLGEEEVGRYSAIGGILIIIGATGALVLGNLLAIGIYEMKFLQIQKGAIVTGQSGLGMALLPFILLLIIGCFIT
ncbi:TPA: QueT transporter family protein [Candidatus Poribacteria bacterium]|nr:QueT transporter family protein [Candidatus Poribacteria bacterium]